MNDSLRTWISIKHTVHYILKNSEKYIIYAFLLQSCRRCLSALFENVVPEKKSSQKWRNVSTDVFLFSAVVCFTWYRKLMRSCESECPWSSRRIYDNRHHWAIDLWNLFIYHHVLLLGCCNTFWHAGCFNCERYLYQMYVEMVSCIETLACFCARCNYGEWSRYTWTWTSTSATRFFFFHDFLNGLSRWMLVLLSSFLCAKYLYIFIKKIGNFFFVTRYMLRFFFSNFDCLVVYPVILIRHSAWRIICLLLNSHCLLLPGRRSRKCFIVDR